MLHFTCGGSPRTRVHLPPEEQGATTLVMSKTPGLKIFAERAMYWDNRGAGTNSIGAWADQDLGVKPGP